MTVLPSMTKPVTLKLGPPGLTPEGVTGAWLRGAGTCLGSGVWVGRVACTWPGVGAAGPVVVTAGAAHTGVEMRHAATKAAAKRGALPFTNPSPISAINGANPPGTPRCAGLPRP